MILEANASPIIARLGRLASERPDDLAFRQLADGRGPAGAVTYRRLAASVADMAEALAPVGPGERVVLSLPAGIDFVSAFLGCLAARVIAVPLPPRPGLRSTTAGLARHPLAADSAAVAAVTADGLVELGGARGQKPAPAAGDVAFLQYTSGSTGTPKGVMVTHTNLASNLTAIQEGMSIGAADRVLVWLPPFHDMGLIGGILQPLWAGIPCTLLAPQVFARRPLTWLEAISEDRSTVSGGPNFAFDMCVDRTTPSQRAALDLSCWQLAFVGSEPVRAGTLRRFAEAFAPAGFLPEALYPCYGLAESTLVVSGGRRGSGLKTVPHPENEDLELVSCGSVLGGQDIKIVDAATGAALPPGSTGQVLVRGGSVTAGYWGNPDAGARTFTEDGWLRTGDLGLLVDNELCVHGRLKDTVVIRGRNLFPEDIEEAVRAADVALRGTAVAAFGVDGAEGERLVVVVEVSTASSRDSDAGYATVAAAVRAAVVRESGVSPAVVAFARRGALPRTTSGKVRRSATRAAYLSAELRLLADDRVAEQGSHGTSLPPMLTREALLRLDPGERRTSLTGGLRAWLAAATGVPAKRVDPDRSLLAAGLDSLMLVQLQGDLAARFGIELAATALAGAESLDALATMLDDRLADAPTRVEQNVATGSATELSATQIAAWYQEQRRQGTSVNLLSRAFRVDKPVDIRTLEATVHLLAERHPALRTVLDAGNPVPTGKLLPSSALRVSVVDARDWSDPVADAALRREAARPFGSAEPLLRACVLRRADHDVLVLTVHHAAVDLWSVSLLMVEFDTIHRALTVGGEPELPVAVDGGVPTPAEQEHLRQWWRATLGTADQVPAMPVDRDAPAARTPATGLVTRALPDVAAGALSDLAGELGVSPFAVLLACWKTVLFAYGAGGPGPMPVTVGSPASGRRRPRTRSVVGFLANPLPLRTEVSARLPFAELARRVHRTVLDALDHQDLPFSAIVEATCTSRHDGHNPLFDTLFVLHQPPRFAPEGTAGLALGTGDAQLTLGAMDLRMVPLPPPDTPVGVTVEIALGEGARETHVALKFARDSYDGRTADLMIEDYLTALRRVLADPGRAVAELTGATTPRQLGRRAVRADAPVDVVHLVGAQAVRQPDAIAVRQGDTVLSYQGVLAASDALAQRLRAAGVRPEVCVGVALPRTPELVVALLAVLRAGGAFFPLDVALPSARQDVLIADTRPAVLLTTSVTAGRVPGGVPQVVLDEPGLWWRSRSGPRALTDEVVHPQQLAYVLFTSGSTGRPKSVALTRGGVSALAGWAARTYSPSEVAGVLAGTPLVFDLSVFELVVTLAVGGTVVLAEHTLDLPRLPERDHVTLVNTVPSVAGELLANEWPAGVRTANLAGEPLPSGLVRELDKAGVGRIMNLYGPCEDTTYSTGTEVDPSDSRLVTIGSPLPGSGAYILTGDGRYTDSAAPGELLLTGPKVARGYLGRPGLTAERFRPDPGQERPGTRAYHTGDQVRRRHDGELIFLGRADRQVKLRGVRIELAEVESALRGCAGVREVAVRVHNAGQPDAALVAYVVGAVQADELRWQAARALPQALVPHHYVPVDRLPRTVSDKLDRAALGRMPVPAADLVVASRAMTSTERLVAEVWSAALEVAAPGPDADFFQQGGHSLLAMRLLAAVETRTGVRVPLEAFLARPTIAGIAEHVDSSVREAVTEDPVPADGELFPLSPTQERFWLIHSLAPKDVAYHVAAVLRLRGRLDLPRLERALAAVVARHDTLRTRFAVRRGEPRLLVMPAAPVRLAVTEVAEEEAIDLGAAEARTPFELTAGPAWRVRLLRTGDEYRLVFVAHHLICDGWSLELLAREIEQFWADDSGTARSAPSFARWAAAQQLEWADPAAAGLAWWRERLANLPDLQLPVDRQSAPAERRVGGIAVRRLPAATVAALDEVCRKEGSTRFAALTALLGVVLGVQSGQKSFGIGTPAAGRTSASRAGIFGCVANTVVLRIDLAGRPTFRELLIRAWADLRGAIAYQEVPFAMVVRELTAGRPLEAAPLFRVMIADQPRQLDLALGGVRCDLTPLSTGTAKFDLSVLIDTGDDVDVTFEYDATLFDESTINELANRFVRLAVAVASDVDVVVDEVDLADDAERTLVASWGDGGAVPDMGVSSLPEAVLRQASRTPDRIAVTARDGSLSYEALATHVNRLAVGLRRRGIGAEDRIAICHERTSVLVVAVLGVLAAGAAYLPIRLTDPAERRAEMLADAEVRLVLCDAETQSWLDTWGVPAATVAEVVAEVPTGSVVPWQVDDRQLAYVLYTSGSTGRPKGVAVTHRGAMARVIWACSSFSGEELSGVLAATALGFDLSLFELFAPLAAGGTAVLAENILELRELPDRARITMVTAVPSSMAALLDMDGWPATVRTVGLGGEPLSAQLAERVRELSPGRVVNLYGTTEDSFCSTWARLDDDVITVGRPLPGTRISVVDDDADVVPLGVTGEITAAGVGVSRGYLKRPGLTADVYRPDPAGPPGSRLYRTGDRGRWTGRGLRMSGRRDDQVKVRGHRVELGEVEAALVAVDGVAEAVALVKSGPAPGDARLVAYVRASNNAGGFDVGRLRAALRRRLPDYMVPSSFVVVEQMPYSQSGKLDRAALAGIAVVESSATGSGNGEPPLPGAETDIALLWQDMLGTPTVSRSARFFELGGDSLLAGRMTARVNDTFGADLPIRLIFEDDRLMSFAAHLDRRDLR
ncbi:non-ribosomal peptide synthetase [Amycolatopsis magusensis]|uniref:Amino acid adenylation domain-containing protein n=1 Tax=Amycolatopsis magusensis TaxID=882444 RepID=A0ABS4PWJ0_9PSEU|nr:non-ribosomal peptide synthetase [Amycolatopsis magusensis]MBP2182951.1 amino acid adenylation domain-containing protein [Amycolatopsis magusensis]